MCPCGTFPAGDPSDAHTAQHTAWLNRAEVEAARGDDVADFVGELARVRQERDRLTTAVAGWVARFHAAHEALAIDEFDDDSCVDLETTIQYAVSRYRDVCESEAAAADVISQLRAALKQVTEERQYRSDMLALVRAELEQRRATFRDVVAQGGWCVARDGGRACVACAREIRRGEAYTTDTTRDQQRHVFCPIEGGTA